MKEQNNTTMYDNNQAVSALNKVAGFDPRKFLRKTFSRQGKQEVMRLDLRYKKLWFRLVHPAGRFKVTPLRITEQLAIFEARVFLDRGDTEPIASFTAQHTRQDTPGGLYVQAAQYEALNQALTDAGFGLQFADVSCAPEEEQYGSEVPVGKAPVPAQNEQAAQPAVAPTQEVAPVQEIVKAEMLPTEKETPPPTMPAETPAPQDAAAGNPPVAEVASLPAQEEPAAPIQEDPLPPDIPTQAAEESAEVELPAVAETPVEEAPIPTESTAPTYTEDMPVEEILQRMTFEEAQNVFVDVGTCNGWTIEQVADRRPASLKWYVFGYPGKNNILRAAAQIMMDNLAGQKAG